MKEVVKLQLEIKLQQTVKSQKCDKGIALLIFLTSGLKCGWVVDPTLRPLCSGKETRYPFTEGWVAGPIWNGEEQPVVTRTRSPDLAAYSE